MIIPSDYKDIAIQAALAAGEAIMEIYSTDFSIRLKTDNSPVTQADIASNTIINSILERTPLPILSEENDAIPYKDRKDWDLFWLIDPLDGTKEFIKKNGEFTVNIALIQENKPIFGIIYVPTSKYIYVGDTQAMHSYRYKITDSHMNWDSLLTKGEKLPLNAGDTDTNEIHILCSRSHTNTRTEAYIDTYTQKGYKINRIKMGSALKFCSLAEGNADLYPRFTPCMEWDTAAGEAICIATAAISFTDADGNTMLYNKEKLLSSFFIAGRKSIR